MGAALGAGVCVGAALTPARPQAILVAVEDALERGRLVAVPTPRSRT